jgi:hypothetical protein
MQQSAQEGELAVKRERLRKRWRERVRERARACKREWILLLWQPKMQCTCKRENAWWPCNSAHVHKTALAGPSVEMMPLPQDPLDSNRHVIGGEHNLESQSCVSPSSNNFFELNHFRSSELLTANQGCELLTVQPNSLQVLAHQDSNSNSQADLILNILLTLNDECRKVIIVKLVSHSDVCRSIEEVLSSVPIAQATFNKSRVNWKDCTPPYAVDHRAFRNHTHRRNKGLPCDPNPKVCTVGERVATSCAKTKVMASLRSVGTLEHQRLILLRVLSNPSFRNIIN